MSLLPATWIVVGCLLLILLLIVAVLYVLKSREVSLLKKQVDELRDTMRMMRYEEANLARMLHTVGKPKEVLKEQPVAPVEEQSVALVQGQLQEQLEEFVEEFAEEPEKEPLVILEVEEPEQEESLPQEEAIASDEAMPEVQPEREAQSESSSIVPEVSMEQEEVVAQEEVPMAQETPSTMQKQPINERRSAIPVDLFSAWFAEYEDDSVETSVESESASELVQSIEDIPATPMSQSVAETDESAAVDMETEVQMAVEAPKQEETAKPLLDVAVESELNKEDEKFCRKLDRVINARLKNPNLNVDSIAAQFNIGRTNFYRKVRELTGVSPNDYLRRARMERAAELLRTTDLPVSEVCVQVGVPDAQYFSRVFKVYYESTPKAYREKHQTI